MNRHVGWDRSLTLAVLIGVFSSRRPTCMAITPVGKAEVARGSGWRVQLGELRGDTTIRSDAGAGRELEDGVGELLPRWIG